MSNLLCIDDMTNQVLYCNCSLTTTGQNIVIYIYIYTPFVEENEKTKRRIRSENLLKWEEVMTLTFIWLYDPFNYRVISSSYVNQFFKNITLN